ncbi:signal peptidase II [Mucilaginibacter gracilis]|uniref:Lipoprotein signal peptidase n=1 Tax=Mucilaginibacter gracilis TaxID=423350 RepID=A0A495J7B4_9SPHI|nr:signal peptidase II [Mucilaginibacter gracilis]RKR84880.1 signal peptidase II [Mucilaginibacter gracilis]
MLARNKIIFFCLLSVLFIGCDRFTKQLAKDHLMNAPVLSYFHDTFVLEYAENTGAALSLGDNLPKTANFILLSILPLGLMVGLFVYFIKHRRQMSVTKTTALAMIFSGGLGNLIDRIFFDRHVTDFINIGIQNLRTGIFNVADMCVTFGVIILFFCLRSEDKNKQPEAETEPQTTPTEA